MKTVQVLLRETVEHVGVVGDVVDVAAGFARNYLVPRKLAVEATPANVKMMARRRERWDAEQAAKNAEIAARVAALSEVTVKTAEKADEKGNLYGSVKAAAIAKLLTDAGKETDEKAVRLAEPIKTVGSHSVDVHVHGDHNATITVVVEAVVEAGETAETAEAASE